MSNDITESTETLLKDAESSAIRARELTKKLMTFSKSGIPLKKEIVHLPTILKELGQFILTGTSAKFEFEFNPFLKNIKGDPTLLMQIFQNPLQLGPSLISF